MGTDSFVVINGKLVDRKFFSLELSNRAFRFGDSIFETIRVFNGKIPFISEHLDRLFNSLRIVKMKLPTYFSEVYLAEKIKELSQTKMGADNYNARVRLTVFRSSEDNIYFAENNSYAEFIIEYVELLDNKFSYSNSGKYQISLFEELYKSKGVLSQIKTNNVLLHTIAGIEAIPAAPITALERAAPAIDPAARPAAPPKVRAILSA